MVDLKRQEEDNLYKKKILLHFLLHPLGWVIMALIIWSSIGIIRKTVNTIGIGGHILIFLFIFITLLSWHFLVIRFISFYFRDKR
jgi:hypothetical protein